MIDNYVALDLETTGLNPSRDRIIEIGMARFENGTLTADYEQLIHPGMSLPEHITQLTGINDNMLKDKPLIGDVIGDIIAFIGENPILGHNVIFDYSFLKKAAVNSGRKISLRGIDTLKIARRVLPEAEHKSLEYLCQYFDINPGHSHRALDDALSAAMLFEKMHEIKPEDSGFQLTTQLIYAVKKDSPITAAQRRLLTALLEHNSLQLEQEIDMMTKSEASRQIDLIISQYGKNT
ncbi:MAG: exonuclease domain-containing protein [Eubacteriales bacterium]|nr:exonuclease domain-containing protein [Eubacteriales bacterium]